MLVFFMARSDQTLQMALVQMQIPAVSAMELLQRTASEDLTH